MLLSILFSCYILIICGCSTPVQKLDDNTIYEYDLSLKVNGKSGKGTLVVPLADKYTVEVKSSGKLDMLLYNTCHREIKKEGAYKKKGIFGIKDYKETQFSYIPSKDIENKLSCVSHIGAYERIKGRHGWGLIDYITEETNLPATVKCNGAQYLSKGVTICQARQGSIQKISFPTEVIFGEPDGCPKMESENKKEFLYTMPLGKCVYAVMSLDKKYFHRLTLLGYEGVLIRKD